MEIFFLYILLQEIFYMSNTTTITKNKKHTHKFLSLCPRGPRSCSRLKNSQGIIAFEVALLCCGVRPTQPSCLNYSFISYNFSICSSRCENKANNQHFESTKRLHCCGPPTDTQQSCTFNIAWRRFRAMDKNHQNVDEVGLRIFPLLKRYIIEYVVAATLIVESFYLKSFACISIINFL